MSEQLGEKHSAPAASPSREQGKKKKAKKNQQTKLSFMPRNAKTIFILKKKLSMFLSGIETYSFDSSIKLFS